MAGVLTRIPLGLRLIESKRIPLGLRLSESTRIPLGLRLNEFLLLFVAGLFLIGDMPQLCRAQDRQPADGMFVTVPHPIDEGVVNQIQHKIKDAIVRRKRPIGTIVFDFTPDGQTADTADPWMCLKLKDYIRDIGLNAVDDFPKNIATVAFVHGRVSRHSVIPVLACSQIIMSQEATIGPVRQAGQVLKGGIKQIYEELGAKKGIAKTIADLLDDGVLTTDQARKLNLVRETFETKEQVARALAMPPSSMREDCLAGRTKIVAKVELNGPANTGNLESFKRRVKTLINSGHNCFILWLNSEGGDDTATAAQLQEYLRTRRDRARGMPVKVIAYVPPGKSLGAATFLALGAGEIVLGAEAALGDFAYLTNPNPAAADSIEALARENGYPGALFRATLDPDVIVYRVFSHGNTGLVGFVTKADWEADQASKKPRWEKDKSRLTKNNGRTLRITAAIAKYARIPAYTNVDSFTELCGKYDINADTVTVSRYDWLDRLAEFLQKPWVRILLLIVGITGLILEVKIPGFGLPGIVAAICFILFFWSHSSNVYATLAVLLFLLGLVLIGLEIFVIPGFGVTGVSGIILVVVSLLLVTLERYPESPQEWRGLAWSLASFMLSFVCAIGLAILIASFLPQVPYANRLMLKPPEEGEDAEHLDVIASDTEANAALLGAIGFAETPLRPAGKARIGEEYIDVVTQGDFIEAGGRVQVIEIEGNRIVVRKV